MNELYRIGKGTIKNCRNPNHKGSDSDRRSLFFASMNDFYRAGSHALSAVRTQLVIYRGMEVFDLYRAVRALLFAYLTADAAVFAVQLRDLSVVRR